ncbi:hypothetical protein HX810_28870 [Pseudomonas salomonii]|uniref:Uncharacterized protein n=1 Tax=Pseudomonas salomonii TaxID=191391 RepID=A0A1H3UIW9_9PSED|nr:MULTISPECIES: hypothetical protein [Pseudomonas]NWF11694.1 hypothetical protein [Pseudomonas salomonii]CRM76037.1 hypothetical protein [Pseudomonas sp. 58 R 3]SDZ62423.1 hypothetical protein SAMN05216247_114124 [Pseudomonas salomonii]
MIFSKILLHLITYPRLFSLSELLAGWLIVVALLISSADNPAQARSRLGELDVRLVNESPCFSPGVGELDYSKGPIQLSAVIVSDTTTAPYTEVWSFYLTGQARTVQSLLSCITYGQTPAQAADVHGPIPLQTGRVYTAFVDVDKPDARDPTFGYMAYFCLLKHRDNLLRLVKLEFVQDRWNVEACDPGLPDLSLYSEQGNRGTAKALRSRL